MACGCELAVGNGQLIATQRTVAPFNGIEANGGIHVTVQEGPQSLTVRTDENLQALLVTRVLEGILVVEAKPGVKLLSENVDVAVTVEQLTSINSSGGAQVEASFGGRGGDLSLGTSGGGVVTVNGVEATNLRIESSGGGHVTAQGTATTVAISASGGCVVTTKDVNAEEVSLDASGGSQLRVRASGQVKGSLSGGASATVYGGPKVAVHTSGGSSVALGQ